MANIRNNNDEEKKEKIEKLEDQKTDKRVLNSAE